MRIHRWIGAAAVALLLSGALAPGGAAQGRERHFRLSGEELVVSNLIGEVRVEGHAGSDFEIEVLVQGDDATEERLEFKVSEGGKARFTVVYPTDEERRYVYPPMGRGSKSTFSVDSDGRDGDWIGEVLSFLGRERITVSGSGGGLEIWADLTVRVPSEKKITVRQVIGSIHGEDLESDAVFDTHSGQVTATDVDGDLLVDTGSGAVEVSSVRGDLNIDTGSGSVTMDDCEGESILVDTGSGAVDARGIRCGDLTIDTGSGRVVAEEIEANHALIDTGSGSVDFELNRMGSGSFVIDTGSGSIDLTIPRDASAYIEAETGSGRVTCDLEGATIDREERDEIAVRLGDGDAHVHLDAGNGSIRIRH